MYLNETLRSRGAPIIGYRKYPISANIFHMGNPISNGSDIIFGWSSGGQEAILSTNTHVSTYNLYQPTCIEVLICKQMMKALTQQ